MLNDEISYLESKIKSLEKRKIEQEIIKDQLLDELKETFDIDSFDGAKKLLAKLEKDLDKRTKELNKKYEEFINEFSEELELL